MRAPLGGGWVSHFRSFTLLRRKLYGIIQKGFVERLWGFTGELILAIPEIVLFSLIAIFTLDYYSSMRLDAGFRTASVFWVRICGAGQGYTHVPQFC
jgi:hypothetical protein